MNIEMEKMDWFHCNRCFRRKGQNFAVSSCGHICCERCFSPKQCIVCGASCNYQPITDKMKPQEQVFFMDPVKLIQSRLEHIAQIALFQRRQKEIVAAYLRHKSVELERHLKDVTEQGYRQISELKRENSELKKPLSQRRASPGQFQTINGTQRMTLPVAVTSPVTPRSQTMSIPGSVESQERARLPRLSLTTPPGSATSISSSLHQHRFRTPTSLTTPTSIPGSVESQERARVPRLSLTTPPGSATSISSSLHQHRFRTPTSLTTPTRAQHLTSNIFQFQFMNGSSLQSTRPLRNGH